MWELLGDEERVQRDKSLDASLAPTETVRRKVETVRSFLDKSCFVTPEAEANWAKATAPMKQRILSELIWRASCILDKSVTAVGGLTRFDLGYGFRVHHKVEDGKEMLVVV